MGSQINILDSDQIKRFGQALCSVADACDFIDASVEQAYTQSEEELSRLAYELRQKLQQAKDALEQAEDEDARNALQAQVSELAQRVNKAEQLLHEVKTNHCSYDIQAKELQAEFAPKAQKAGSVLVSFIEELEKTA